MSETITQLILSLNSLWLLLAEYAPITVVGIENPYQGWLVEDIETDAEKNIKALREAGLLITHDNDDSYELRPDLRLAVDLIAKPQTIVISLDSSSGQMGEQVYYYLNEQDAIRLSQPSTLIQLEHISDRESLLDALLNPLPIPKTPITATAFTVPEDLLFQAFGHAVQANYQEALNLLDDVDLTEAARNELMEALQNRQANASFAILTPPTEAEEQRVNGFGVLAGGNRLWTIAPANKPGKSSVEFSPITPEHLRQRLADLLPFR